MRSHVRLSCALVHLHHGVEEKVVKGLTSDGFMDMLEHFNSLEPERVGDVASSVVLTAVVLSIVISLTILRVFTDLMVSDSILSFGKLGNPSTVSGGRVSSA